MKIEFYMILPLLVGIYNLYFYLIRKDSKEPVYKRSTPIHLMLAFLGTFLFVFFIFNS